MKRLQRILAPIDMSESSRPGLKLAMALAAENGADLRRNNLEWCACG